MPEKIILNKKKSIINSIIIPIIFTILYFMIYEITPTPTKEIGQIIKGIFSMLPFFIVAEIIIFWGIILILKRKNKKEICLQKKKTIFLSFILPIIIGVLFIVGFYLAPKNKSLYLDYIQSVTNIFNIFICITTILVVIIFWLIILFSKENIKNEK